MERKIEKFLLKWKTDIIRKPLILYGPKGVGKSYTTIKFGQEYYNNVAYINSEYNEEALNLFNKEKSTKKIIDMLSEMTNEEILPETTLIVIDNLTSTVIAKTLRLFGSEHSKYHIIAITSNRSKLTEFKDENLQFKSMGQMDFEEYLWAYNEKEMANLIRKSFTKKKTFPFHKVAMRLFKDFIETGGLPELVQAKLLGSSELEIEIIKQKNLEVYRKEISQNNNLIDIQRGLEVFNSIGKQLLKDNRKFQYGLLGEGRRAKEYASSIEYLVSNQLAYRSFKVSDIKIVLSSVKEKDSFKLYMPDDGMLYTMLHLNRKKVEENENIKELLYENHIAHTLSDGGYGLYYYASSGKAELSFVIQNRKGEIIPIELNVRSNSKAKSLSVFMKKFTVKKAYRITENNFQTKKDIRYIPIYSTFCFNDNN